jgi:hypothetical protein
LLNTDSIPQTPNLPSHLVQYYKNANEAKWLFYNKKYKEAIVKYKTAFQIAKPQAQNIGDLVECYLGLNQKDSANKYAFFFVKNFDFDDTRLYYDSNLNEFYNQEKFRNAKGEFFAKTDMDRRVIMIEHYVKNDFFFRSKFSELNLGNEVKNKGDFAFKIALQYDSIHAIPYILKLIKECDFPNAYDIGINSVHHFMFLLRHYNIEKYLLDSALYNGKILPEEYASLVEYKFNWDWSGLSKPGPLKPKLNYGVNFIKPNDTMTLGEIDDIQNVDKRREAIGLMPLWQYAKYKNIELSDAYKKSLELNKINY